SKKALAWLANTQREDGSWGSSYGSTTGIVAACALAFMSAGHVPGSGEHGVNTARAMHYLMECA
ncbi:MAG TPA: prenyltransferase, partial [Planctomycetota bacterium]|nr:prenyltransferase [Planctomycetota bacterium]